MTYGRSDDVGRSGRALPPPVKLKLIMEPNKCTFLQPENAQKRPKTLENVRKYPFRAGCKNVRKFSSEGHAAPILRRVRGAARPRPQPRRGRGGRRRHGRGHGRCRGRGRFVHLFSRTFIGKRR